MVIPFSQEMLEDAAAYADLIDGLLTGRYQPAPPTVLEKFRRLIDDEYLAEDESW